MGNMNARFITAPATDAAKQWSGWGTALKPASEHWILVRKPVNEKNVAANVLKWGTGGINVDRCRVQHASADDLAASLSKNPGNADKFTGQTYGASRPQQQINTSGRFPANLVLSHSPHCTDDQCDIECAIKALDTQSGPCKTGALTGQPRVENKTFGKAANTLGKPRFYTPDAATGASRFFYCAKISTSERHIGLVNTKEAKRMSDARPNSPDMSGKFPDHDGRLKIGNHHPTVKPQKLMRYLCRLITPPAGTVLDPFMGSGSTGMAAKAEGFQFIGIERDAEYYKIAEARIANAP